MTEFEMKIRPTPELFHSAAQVLRERGLARGVIEDDNGRVCLLGACGMAATGTPRNGMWLFDVTEVLARAVGSEVGDAAFTMVAEFNDHELIDAEDGARFLERVGASLE